MPPPGQIWLDASLLDSGRFSWGVVQHEYAHQVDFGAPRPTRCARSSSRSSGTRPGGARLDHDSARLRALRRRARLGLLALARQRHEAAERGRRATRRLPGGACRRAPRGRSAGSHSTHAARRPHRKGETRYGGLSIRHARRRGRQLEHGHPYLTTARRSPCVIADDHPPIIDCLSRYLTRRGLHGRRDRPRTARRRSP